MNPIDETFQKLRQQGRSALMPFMTIGDPDPETSLMIIREMESAGADMIELGVPYSDPLADGPVIQRASGRALEHGVTIRDCIRVAGEARRSGVRMPFILFSYYNPVLQTGLDTFFSLLQENDISGLIIPDLPHEEDATVREAAAASGVHLIPLVAPTSHERIRRIVSRASGFVYCVSSLGVTGVRSDFDQEVDSFLETVREASEVPIAIGFGISRPEHVARFSRLCDGIIVGSAIVRQVEDNLELLRSESSRSEGLANIRQFVATLSEATRTQK